MHNIAIDGPAGAGKSTIAKEVAKKLDFIYVDTGAMYRAMALYVLRQGISAEDEDKVAAVCNEVQISIAYENGEQQVLLGEETVNDYIRTEEVSMVTSNISKYAAVREKLLDLQRELAATKNVVMDGRDIGTCVLPHADVKIYLTATASERARRRYKEQIERGMDCELDQIERDIIARDEQDMNRKISPLRQAVDAVFVDSSNLTIDQVVSEIISIYQEKTY